MSKKSIGIGIHINKLRRYKVILELYNTAKAKEPSKTTMQIWKQDIIPVYPISRTTLYEVLNTQIDKQLKELGIFEEIQSLQEDIRIRIKGSSYRISVNNKDQLIITKTAITESNSNMEITLRGLNEIQIK